MTSFPNTPKLIKGGIVLLDPTTARIKDIISLQYYPETMSRSFQIQNTESTEGGDRSQALRLKGPPIESYKLEAEIDATDFLEKADSQVAKIDLQPKLAILESLFCTEKKEIIFNE